MRSKVVAESVAVALPPGARRRYGASTSSMLENEHAQRFAAVHPEARYGRGSVGEGLSVSTSRGRAFVEPSRADGLMSPPRVQALATFRAYTFLMARCLLTLVLLISGLGKITTYEATATFMESAGVPGVLLPVVIATQVLGAYSILLGWETRVVSLLMAAFIAATIAIFRDTSGDPMQTGMFLKSLLLVGALLVQAAVGAGPLSLDGRKGHARRDHDTLSHHIVPNGSGRTHCHD